MIIHLLFHFFLLLGYCLVFFNIQLYPCDCSVRVTAVLEYLELAFHVPLFCCASIMDTARPIIMGCRLLIGVVSCLIVIDQPRSC